MNQKYATKSYSTVTIYFDIISLIAPVFLIYRI